MTTTIKEIAELAKTLSDYEALSVEDTRKLGAAYINLWELSDVAEKLYGALKSSLEYIDHEISTTQVRDTRKAMASYNCVKRRLEATHKAWEGK